MVLSLVLLILFMIILVITFKRNTMLGMYPIRVDHSPVSGYGVFATRDIRKGEIIEECPYIVSRSSNVLGILKNYVFKKDKTNDALVFGYGSIYNHKDDNNAEWKIKDKLIVTALKDIQKGDEIFVHYGDEYWRSRRHMKKL